MKITVYFNLGTGFITILRLAGFAHKMEAGKDVLTRGSVTVTTDYDAPAGPLAVVEGATYSDLMVLNLPGYAVIGEQK